jgi:GT2 family glycosyltransferase
MTASPAISVVVPTYKRPDLLRKCLDSLRAQDLVADRFEVIVVDDASGDSTPEVLGAAAADWPALTWSSQPANAGPASARNVAIAAARSELILFIDDDIVAPPNLLSTHLLLHEAGDPLLGVVGQVEWAPDIEVGPFMRWLDTTTLQFAFATMHEGPVERPWEAFYTCNLSVAKSLLTEVGGFDERFPYPAFEDTDLGIRLSRRGFHLDYRPEALAWHARAVTLEEFCARMRKVGESATLLREAQPDLSLDLPNSDAEPTGARKLAVRALPLAATLMPTAWVRGLAYRARVNRAFREGVRLGLARAAQNRK